MASELLRHHIDIEAQNLDSRPPEAGTSKMPVTTIHRHQAKSDSDDGQAQPVSFHQNVTPLSDFEPTLLSQVEIDFLAVTLEATKSDQVILQAKPERRDTTRHDATRGGQSETQLEMQTQASRGSSRTRVDTHAQVNDPPVDSYGGPIGDSSTRGYQGKRMIGDYDDSANPLWTLYGREAKSQDESRIGTLNYDMDGVVIFGGLFSVALTAFILNSKQSLKASPADQTVYYLQQNVAILDQISRQISSIAPQVTIPSTSPPPFPTFHPTSSDVRVNAFWFMALVFSLSAVLLATLVRQWVRDYMHVFQRYRDPLKSARIRQYLYEGCEGWYMPVIAEAVPGLLHVSVFLFFVGLGDFILNINTAVGLSTIVPISICALLYIFTTFAPVIDPQSPYHNPLSALVWCLAQKLGGWRYRSRDGESKSVSTNMAEGRMQLAMEETEDRKGRDARSIEWLLKNLTDSELESLTMAIPGSFNGQWGSEVWRNMSELTLAEDDNRRARQNDRGSGPPSDFIFRLHRTPTWNQSDTNMIPLLPVLHSSTTHLPIVTAPPHERGVVREFSTHICHLFETCKNRGSFASDELWQKRTRACVEGAASLIFFAGADLEWFGDIGRLLRDIGKVERTRKLSIAGMNQPFVTRWACLSVLATRSMLKHNSPMQEATRDVISILGAIPVPTGTVDSAGRASTTMAQVFDKFFNSAWHSLYLICAALFNKLNTVRSEEQLKQVLQTEPHSMEYLRHFNLHVGGWKEYDSWIANAQRSIQFASQELICELPGVEFDCDRLDPLPFSQVTELLHDFDLQFVLFGQSSASFSSIVPRLQNILDGQTYEPGQFQELLDDLKSFLSEKAALWSGDLAQLQSWRFQDLCNAGGLGFMVETFFIVLKQLLSTSLSEDSQSALYVSTFRAITSDWREHKESLGTQNVLLHMIASGRGLMSNFNYPDYITEELFSFMKNIFSGQTGPHIDNAVEQLIFGKLHPSLYHGPPGFRDRVLKLLSSSQRAASTLS